MDKVIVQQRNSSNPFSHFSFQVFNFDVRHLNWSQYMENYVLGIKKYLLKEDMAGIPEVKQHLRR